MPSEAVPVIVAVVAFFSTFIVVLGGVSVWTSLPTRASGRSPSAR